MFQYPARFVGHILPRHEAINEIKFPISLYPPDRQGDLAESAAAEWRRDVYPPLFIDWKTFVLFFPIVGYTADSVGHSERSRGISIATQGPRFLDCARNDKISTTQ
jgi:hypothetical protein